MMQKRIKFAAIIVPGLFLLQCGSKMGDIDMVAKVGNIILTRQDLQTQMMREGYLPDQEKAFVDRWIHRELLYQEAMRLHLNASEDLQEELKRIEKELLISKLLERTYKEKVQMTEEEILSYYDQNISDFKLIEDDARIQHMLFDSRSEASLALQEIQTGKSFENVAKARSIDAFAAQGGEMGYIKKSDVIPEVERWAFHMLKNEISPIFSSSFGFHLLKVLDRRSSGEVKPLSEVRGDIMQRLRVIKEGQIYYDLIYQLQNRNKYYIFQPSVQNDAPDSTQQSNTGTTR
jgi:peptidyl-prolyl cis-trans isomerase C